MCTTDSDGHSGAVHQRRYFFGRGSVAAFFRHQRQAAAPLFFFFSKKRQHFSTVFFSKISAAAATADKLLPRLFQFTLSRYRLESLLSACFHSVFVTSLFQFNRAYKTFVTF